MGVIEKLPNSINWKQNCQRDQKNRRNEKTEFFVTQKEGIKVLKKVDLKLVFVIKDMNHINFNSHFSSNFCLKATSIILLFSNQNNKYESNLGKFAWLLFAVRSFHKTVSFPWRFKNSPFDLWWLKRAGKSRESKYWIVWSEHCEMQQSEIFFKQKLTLFLCFITPT